MKRKIMHLTDRMQCRWIRVLNDCCTNTVNKVQYKNNRIYKICESIGWQKTRGHKMFCGIRNWMKRIKFGLGKYHKCFRDEYKAVKEWKRENKKLSDWFSFKMMLILMN